MTVTVSRAYDPATPDDGIRVLVDRLWPRGVSKADASIDVWLKNVAPSPELRKAWHSTDGWHEGAGFGAFKASYLDELEGATASQDAQHALATLRDLVQAVDTVTLVTASKDPEMSHVAVLLELVA